LNRHIGPPLNTKAAWRYARLLCC